MTKLALDATEVARALDVHPATLAAHLPEMYRRGFPRPQKIGRCRRWSRQAVEDWLAGGAKASSRDDDKELREAIRAL